MARQKYTTGPGWRIEWRKFTKDDARRAVANYREDRPTDESWVNALAMTMDMGLWDTYSPDQTPIAFDRDGFRVNGKHRFLAFDKSKLTEIVFPVIVGLAPESFRAFDQNRKARLHKHAHPGRKNVKRDESRINWLEAIVQADPTVKVTTPVFGALVDGKWKRQIVWADETLRSGGKQGKAPYACALMYVHRADSEFADKVGRAWMNGGAGLPKQLLRIRDRALSANTYTGARSDRLGQTMKMLQAFALMHQGKPIPDRLHETLAGLRYWSAKNKDGAISRWEKTTVLAAEED